MINQSKLGIIRVGVTVFFGIIIGALVGAILLTALTALLDIKFRSNVGASDMYSLYLLLTVPNGILLGAPTGLSTAMILLRKSRAAGYISILASFIGISSFVAHFSRSMRNEWHSPDWQEMIRMLRSDSFVFWLLLFWSIWLLLQGIMLLRKIPNVQSGERYS